MSRFLSIVFLILVAMSVRLYHITDHTEFLGDQGRDALVIREMRTKGTLPVVGPTVGAGYYTGPFYYYLIAPSFMLFGNNSVAPAIEMSLVSVAAILLFLNIATSLFSFPVAYGVSFFWALSPLMIIQDRRLWNPTPIPFFIILLIASLLWIYKKKYWGYLTASIAEAALIQLHYVNVISLCIALIMLLWIISQGKIKKMLPWCIISAVLLIGLLLPFISYEASHGFQDISGSLMTLAFKEGQLFSKRLYVQTYIDISTRLLSYIAAIPWKIPLLIISIGIVAAHLRKKEVISYLLVLWFCIGIACLSFYKDTFQPQYAYQFIPIVFLILAGIVRNLRTRATQISGILVGIVLTAVSWVFANPYKTTDPDIPRMNALTDAVIAKAENKPFAFTIMNSRSFTDFHARYFFRMKNAEIVPVADGNNKTLFIVCEAGCVEAELLSRVSVMCHTDVCPLDKPVISLSDWTYVSTERIGSSAVYAYTR